MLTSKQRSELRGLASKESALFQIGKNSIDENYIISISNALDARELIKINVLDSCEYTPAEFAAEITNRTDSETVAVIGRKVVIYRKSRKK